MSGYHEDDDRLKTATRSTRMSQNSGGSSLFGPMPPASRAVLSVLWARLQTGPFVALWMFWGLVLFFMAVGFVLFGWLGTPVQALGAKKVLGYGLVLAIWSTSLVVAYNLSKLANTQQLHLVPNHSQGLRRAWRQVCFGAGLVVAPLGQLFIGWNTPHGLTLVILLGGASLFTWLAARGGPNSRWIGALWPWAIVGFIEGLKGRAWGLSEGVLSAVALLLVAIWVLQCWCPPFDSSAPTSTQIAPRQGTDHRELNARASAWTFLDRSKLYRWELASVSETTSVGQFSRTKRVLVGLGAMASGSMTSFVVIPFLVCVVCISLLLLLANWVDSFPRLAFFVWVAAAGVLGGQAVALPHHLRLRCHEQVLLRLVPGCPAPAVLRHALVGRMLVITCCTAVAGGVMNVAVLQLFGKAFDEMDAELLKAIAIMHTLLPLTSMLMMSDFSRRSSSWNDAAMRWAVFSVVALLIPGLMLAWYRGWVVPYLVVVYGIAAIGAALRLRKLRDAPHPFPMGRLP